MKCLSSVSRLGVAGVAALIVGAAPGARAQSNYTFGGDARVFAMGGAGIALLPDRGGQRLNPASLTFETSPAGFSYPTLGLRSDGIDQNATAQFLLNGTKAGDAGNVARTFAKQDSSFGVNANIALRIAHVELSGFAVGVGRFLPNEALRTWANGPTSGNQSTIPTNARADIYGAGYYTFPAVAVGTTLPTAPASDYNYGVGMRVKEMHGVYTHYIADQNTLNNSLSTFTNDAFLAPEMNGSKTLTKKGLGVDLGILARPRINEGWSVAAIAANFIKPSFKFQGTARDGKAATYDILKSTYSAGVGYQKKSLTFAADLVDLTGATGKAQFRTGIEEKLIPQIAVRGGYNSGSGYTYGVGFFGFDVSAGKRSPLEVVKTINF